MTIVKPIFRIFDYDKAVGFYVGWLGFKIDWEHRPHDAPLYMQVSLGDIVLHLSEHHGDCCPGAKAHIDGFKGLKLYHTQLLEKNYKFNRPGLETPPWNENSIYMQVIDPFGNRLVFNEEL